MNFMTLASSQSNAAALEKATTRHTELTGAVTSLTATLVAAADQAAADDLARAHSALAGWLATTLEPVLSTQAATLLPLARAEAGAEPLVLPAAQARERISAASQELRQAQTPVRTAAAGVAVREAVVGYLSQVSDFLLPALARTSTVSLEGAMQQMAAAAASPADATGQGAKSRGTTVREDQPARAAETSGHRHGGCACGGSDEAGMPELDTRVIPHAIRHATIFGALDALAPGRGLLLVANHNPLPLLAQLEQRAAGQFTVDYLEDGPDTWRLSLLRN